MKSELITLLETLNYPVFLQGSINSLEEYPESFFTYWNFETPESAFYDDNAGRAVWGFWVYFYSTDPTLVETQPEAARKLLKANGWILQGKVEAYNEAKEVAADPNAPECTDPDKIMEFMLA